MSITFMIIIATGIVTYMGFNDHSLFDKFKFSVSGIQSGEYYRLITSAFLHADWTHFIFNMITLYFFGDFTQSAFGTQGLLMIYFGGIILGNYLSYYFHKNNLWYAAIGASGGVNAVVFAAITVEPFMTINFIIPGFLYALGYLWYTTKGTQSQSSNIGHEAHFGGAIIGVALALILNYQLSFIAHPIITILIIGALVGGYIYMEKKKI